MLSLSQSLQLRLKTVSSDVPFDGVMEHVPPLGGDVASTHSLLTVHSLNKHCQAVFLSVIKGVLFDYKAARIEGRSCDKLQILYFPPNSVIICGRWVLFVKYPLVCRYLGAVRSIAL